MSKITNIVEELQKIHYSPSAWHGPGLTKILTGVDSSTAARQPYPDYRSIWELVLHISKWEEVFCLRLEGHEIHEPAEGDWPQVSDKSEPAWQEALRFLDRMHNRLIATVSELNEEHLAGIVPGKDYTIRFMLHGIVRHHVYHSGQIALLKRVPL